MRSLIKPRPVADTARHPDLSANALGAGRFRPGRVIGRWLPLSGLALFAWLTIYLVRPPRPVPANAPATEFSALRARQPLGTIARAPHSIGTAAHGAVREYLVQNCRAMGLRTWVQDTTVITGSNGMLTAARVRNVIARLHGRTPGGRAVLVLAHYDSQPHTLGASDNGTGVAAALETIRALRAGPLLAHDVLWVFTDGEEVGLLGAQAFAADTARLQRNVGVVLNFEARGNSGASALFEANNGWALREFAQAAPVPVGSSLAYEIYRYLPNSTDFTAFRAADIPGLNFAFSDGYSYYHSMADSPDHVDLASLQHQGEYMLPLVRHFASISLVPTTTPAQTFFNPLGTWLVLYDARWNYLLSLLGGVALLTAVVRARRRGRLRLRGLLAGALAWLGGMALLLATGWGLLQLVSAAYPQYAVFYDQAFYNVHCYHLALVLLGMAVFGAYYQVLRRWLQPDSLSGGVLVLLTALQLPLQLQVPALGYLLGFPLLFGSLGWLASLPPVKRQPVSSGIRRLFSSQILGAVLLLPAVALLAPLLAAVLTLAGLGSLLTLALLLLTMLLGLLLPALLPLLAHPARPASRAGSGYLPLLAGMAGLGALGAGHASQEPTAAQPQQIHLYYLLDADHAQAYWLSGNPRLNAWTQQLLRNPTFGPLPVLLPGSTQPLLHQAAPALALAAPSVTVLADSTSLTGRHQRLVVRAGRAGVVSLRLNWETQRVRGLRIAGHRVAPARWDSDTGYATLTFFAPGAEGLLLELDLADDHPLPLLVTDRSLALPRVTSLPPLPPSMIPAPGYSSFTTQVTKKFSL